jgi:hypothetical protein
MPEGIAYFADDCFSATSIAIARCNCGCGNFKLLLLDEDDVIRASATVPPGHLTEQEQIAMNSQPLRIAHAN